MMEVSCCLLSHPLFHSKLSTRKSCLFDGRFVGLFLGIFLGTGKYISSAL